MDFPKEVEPGKSLQAALDTAFGNRYKLIKNI